MTSLWQCPAVVVAFITWLSAPSASLGEAAQREALRRQLTRPAAATLTNVGQPLEFVEAADAASGSRAAASTPPVAVDDEGVPLPSGSVVPTQPKLQGTAAVPGASAQPATAPAAPGAAGKGDEKAWRDRMTTAREALERDQVLADAMQSRINGLQTDIVNRDDPAQQNQLRQQMSRALTELERLKKQVETDRKTIGDIQTDARKQGVPPGWIR